MAKTKRNCDFCKKEYYADNRNLKRGWGLCCSKECAAKKRERARPDYDPKVVRANNAIRGGYADKEDYEIVGRPWDYRESNYDDDQSWDAHKTGQF